MVFCNGGAHKYFLSSADWMPRNLDGRVEVSVPIYDTTLQTELKAFVDLQWRDNVKARILDENLENRYRRPSGAEPQEVRAQRDFYDVLRTINRPRESTSSETPPATRPTQDERDSVIPFDPTVKRGHPPL